MGSIAFRFDSQKLKNAVDAVCTIELDATQEKLVRDITEIIASRIGMDPIPCRGLWLRAIRDWQVEHGKPATAISTANPEDRAKAAAWIKERFVANASGMLVSPAERAELSFAIGEAFALYLQKYNRRPKPGPERT